MDLKRDSKKLDKIILNDVLSRVFVLLFFIFYFSIFFIVLTPYKTIFLVSWAVFVILFVVLAISFRKRSGKDREVFSFSLLKIGEGVEKGAVKKKYLRFLSKKLKGEFFDDEEEIVENEFLFESEKRKENLFKRNLFEFLEKINYSLERGDFSKIDSDALFEISRDIYYQNRGFVQLVLKLNKIDIGKERISLLGGSFKKIIKNRVGKFIFVEVVLSVLAFLSYLFIIQDKTIVYGVWGVITAAVIGVIFGRK